MSRLNLEVMTKGRLEANVIEGRHFVTISHFSRVQDRPLGEASNAVGPLLIFLVLLDAHFTVALEREEVTF